MRAFARISILGLMLTAVAADAAETITYSYDARNYGSYGDGITVTVYSMHLFRNHLRHPQLP